jgi:hypothetical protein
MLARDIVTHSIVSDRPSPGLHRPDSSALPLIAHCDVHPELEVVD